LNHNSFTLNPKPQALHRKSLTFNRNPTIPQTLKRASQLWTLYPKLWTLDPKLWTLDPKLWTLDPKLWTLDPKLWTLDPKL